MTTTPLLTVEELAAATGRSIRYVQVAPRRYCALLVEQDVPEEVIARLTRAIGREPRDAAREDE